MTADKFNKAMELMDTDPVKAINKNYEKIDRLMMELDDHRLNGRHSEVIRVLKEINRLQNDNNKILKKSHKLIMDIVTS